MEEYHVVYQIMYEDTNAETISFSEFGDMRKWVDEIDEEDKYIVAIYKGVKIQ